MQAHLSFSLECGECKELRATLIDMTKIYFWSFIYYYFGFKLVLYL